MADMWDRARAAFDAVRRPEESYSAGPCLIPHEPPKSSWSVKDRRDLDFFSWHVKHGAVLISAAVPCVFCLRRERGHNLNPIWRGCESEADLFTTHFDQIILYTEDQEDRSAQLIVAAAAWTVSRNGGSVQIAETVDVRDPAYCAVFRQITDVYRRSDVFAEFDRYADDLSEIVQIGLRYLVVDR